MHLITQYQRQKESLQQLQDFKNISIKDYLESRGFKMERSGSKWFCSSPFARDSNSSFCIYPTNTFYCWSTGKSGDIIKLVQLLELCTFAEALDHLNNGEFKAYQRNFKKFKEDEDFWKKFDKSKYETNNEEEMAAIISYGRSRSIYSGFDCGVYFTRNPSPQDSGNKWIRNPAMMFTHVDKDLNVIGAKFRNINNDLPNRFTTRGRLGFYILNSMVTEHYQKATNWLVESETSSNSLWSYFVHIHKPATVISMGGVSSAPEALPDKYQNRETKLIIDYDGNEELYQERLKKYGHLDVTPIKLILEKGEDINSLYHKGEMWKIEQLLI